MLRFYNTVEAAVAATKGIQSEEWRVIIDEVVVESDE